MEEKQTDQQQPKQPGEKSPMTTGVIVLVVIILVLVTIFAFTRSDESDLQEIAPAVGN